MSLADRLAKPAPRKAPGCALRVLGDDDIAAIKEARVIGWRWTKIADEMSDELGQRVTGQTVSRHVAGLCTCDAR